MPIKNSSRIKQERCSSVVDKTKKSVKTSEFFKRISSQYNKTQFEKLNRVISFREYLEEVVDNPKLVMLAHERMYRMIMSYGTEAYEVNGEKKVRYKLFSDKLFGIDDPLAEMVDYFRASAERLDTRKRILLFHGPVSSSKSTVVTILKQGMEKFSKTDEGSLFVIGWPQENGLLKLCDNLDDPIKFIPEEERAFFNKEYGIYIEGLPCPQCRKKYKELEEKHKGDIEAVYNELCCKRVTLSEADRVGIGTFSPADPKCVTGDTLVLTGEGLQKIEDIYFSLDRSPKVDEFVPYETTVFGVNGPEKTSKFYYGGIHPVFEVETEYGYRIRGTKNHPLMVLRPDGEMEWRKIGDLKSGDYVALARNTQMCKKHILINKLVLNETTFTSNFSYETSSKKLAQRVQSVLLESDFVSSLSIKEVNGKFSYRITSCEKITKGLPYGSSSVAKRYLWLEVREVRPDGEEPVYDLLVPGTHSFVANGFYSHNSQDMSELVGGINFKNLPTVGSESDPDGWKFDGELNRSNRGIAEFIEMLKVDERFLHILLTLAQERKIKTPRFPLTSADEIILGHSVAGETPILYRYEGLSGWTTLAKLEDRFRENSAGLEVFAYDFDNKLTRWTPVRRVFRHQFEGELMTTSQKWGVVETTPNHSIYARDGETFYPEERREILAVRQIADSFEISGSVDIVDGVPGFVRDDALVTSTGEIMTRPPKCGWDRISLPRQKTEIKAIYDPIVEADLLKDLITVLVWYATEGHINNSGIVITQNDKNELERVRGSYSRISTGEGSIDSGSKTDSAWRLYCSSKAIKKIAEYHCGKLSQNKRLPDFLFRLPAQFLQHAFDELMRTDGTRKLDKATDKCACDAYRNSFFDYKTTSPLLAAQVGTLATLLGYDYSVGYWIPENKKRLPYYRVRFCNAAGKAGGRHKRFKAGLHCRKPSEPTWVYDIECEGLHNFICGVGNVVCHNTNENEYAAFLSDPKREALKDRMIKIDFKYNLVVSEEVKIYERLLSEEAKESTKHRAPNSLKVAALFGILTRLEEWEKGDLLTKAKLYDGQVVTGFKEKDIKEMRERAKREGLDGVSPRLLVNVLSEAQTMEDVQCLSPFVIMKNIHTNLKKHKFPKIDTKKQEEYLDHLDMARKEYVEMAKKDVLKAFLESYEEAMEDLCRNYIDNVRAYVEKRKLKDPVTGEDIEPDDKSMKSIEELIDDNISDSRREQFRSSLLASIGSILYRGEKFNYRSDERLRKAIEKKIFNDNKGNIRFTTFSGSKTDEKNLKRLEAIKERMINDYGYCEHCAKDVMNFVGGLLAKGDTTL